MKTNKYLLIPVVFLLTSCYIYKPYSEKELDENANTSVKNSVPVAKSIRNENSNQTAQNKVLKDQGKQELSPEELEQQRRKEQERENQKAEEKQNPSKASSNSSFSRSDGSTDNNPKKTGKPTTADEPQKKEIGIRGKLEPNKYYKIKALGNQYKIQVDKWEGDTLVSHKIRRPEKVYKHHINDIEEEAILERRFSKPFSDLLTVGAYASGAVIVLLLIL